MDITESQEALLAENGWTVSCKSPLEIQHRDGSRATGLAAAYALPEILADLAVQHIPLNSLARENNSYEMLAEILALIKHVQAYREQARLLSSKGVSTTAWETAYKLVFNPECSGRIHVLLDKLGTTLDYCDPNSSYEDDVVAFADALELKSAELEPFMAAVVKPIN